MEGIITMRSRSPYTYSGSRCSIYERILNSSFSRGFSCREKMGWGFNSSISRYGRYWRSTTGSISNNSGMSVENDF